MTKTKVSFPDKSVVFHSCNFHLSEIQNGNCTSILKFDSCEGQVVTGCE